MSDPRICPVLGLTNLGPYPPNGVSGDELQQAVLEATNAASAAAKQLYAEAIHQMVTEMDLNLPGIEGVLKTLTGGG